ncbi:hypothetical protein C8J98_104188 [Luteibacter sp. OK325]|jgi:hypothetical protein|uniref:hypothetical protein n=1 Tax=Luteibacter sp. OK325 TaxID=2135670 RepID=UPI000D3B03CB|nr:hypothetical protein [Luteibacter sp. OK325]PTR32977.1 hypothetical protein C8J98_104188 [Luteibacter sp. OK325]
MKSLTLALLLGLPLMASAQTPGTHGHAAPLPEPMKRFAWRDEAAGYTFVAPPRWAGKVKAVPLDSKALAKSGATSGVRFVAGSKTLLVLLATDEVRSNALVATGNRELSRYDGHVVAVKAEADAGDLALTDAELASAVEWDGGQSGTVAR